MANLIEGEKNVPLNIEWLEMILIIIIIKNCVSCVKTNCISPADIWLVSRLSDNESSETLFTMIR